MVELLISSEPMENQPGFLDRGHEPLFPAPAIQIYFHPAVITLPMASDIAKIDHGHWSEMQPLAKMAGKREAVRAV
jgi:hypothetical protein